MEGEGDEVVVVKEAGEEGMDFWDLSERGEFWMNIDRLGVEATRLGMQRTVLGPPMFIMTIAV